MREYHKSSATARRQQQPGFDSVLGGMSVERHSKFDLYWVACSQLWADMGATVFAVNVDPARRNLNSHPCPPKAADMPPKSGARLRTSRVGFRSLSNYYCSPPPEPQSASNARPKAPRAPNPRISKLGAQTKITNKPAVPQPNISEPLTPTKPKIAAKYVHEAIPMIDVRTQSLPANRGRPPALALRTLMGMNKAADRKNQTCANRMLGSERIPISPCCRNVLS